jgi:hypothetical protein
MGYSFTVPAQSCPPPVNRFEFKHIPPILLVTGSGSGRDLLRTLVKSLSRLREEVFANDQTN